VLIMTLGGCASTGDWYHLPTLEFDEVDYGYQVHHARRWTACDIAYLDEGRGEQTLLLIHGLGTSAKGWQRNLPALSRAPPRHRARPARLRLLEQGSPTPTRCVPRRGGGRPA
jgi:hypothetical protein